MWRKKSFTIAELIAACTGHEYIRPPPRMPLIIISTDITEEQLIKMLEKAVYVEMCIEINRSTFKRLRMPNLKEITCQLGLLPILPEFDAYLKKILIPLTTTYSKGEQIVRIQRLPSLPYTTIADLQLRCPQCSIIPDFGVQG
ncbi:unnamed protein product [Cylicocyclus nassatus]|uniref:Uncharacterized protein n=1 Tax=Cylicocyclus nassatus TaxID=53992 RepID=A0AA36M4Z2_CYLNA|nr:unnamed protein product [Cylicocyclus nassatus]